MRMRLAPELEDGTHVAMRRAMCPVCGVEHDSGEILLNNQLRKVFPSYGKVKPDHYKLCEEHQKLYDSGFVALIAVRGCHESTCKLENADRTGALAHLKARAWPGVFGGPVPTDEDGELLPLVFCDADVISMLQKSQEESQEQ